MAGKLTELTVKALMAKGRHTPGRHTDEKGLHLHIRADGNAAWVLRYRQHGRQRDLNLLPYADKTLKVARDAADAARVTIKAGKDPIRERQQQARAALEAASADRTFRAALESTLEAKAGAWKNEKHRWQWRATLETHALPKIGELPVSEVTTDDVMAVLRPIWTRTPETASRLRGRIETVLDHAKVRGWRSGENPARWRGHLREMLADPSKIAPVQRQPALPWVLMPAFMAALRARKGMAAVALQFTILTAARTGEVRGATWGEIDTEARVWTIQAARMKAGEMHRVPLSHAAMTVLAALRPEQSRPGDLIFPGARAATKPLSDMALAMLVRGMATDGLEQDAPPRWRDLTGRVVVPHGFRSAFRDWAGETRHEGREVAERALAHAVGGVEGAYARSDLLEKRRPLMQAWGEWCERAPGGAAVVPLDTSTAKQAVVGGRA
ncbi:tyrosine-type recombinase/integrase [Humitalea sp. 24SJ18S-53]|uniref:tyrosine-type recombinase/integrase n=1 Tax=Humitalea sp. 24SJ18S-53 TaxID=3422307 RepID=UPI003D671643